MSLQVDSSSLVRAVKHPANCKPIIFCSVSLVGMGSLLVVLGIVIMLIDYIELGPPHFDSEFNRYAGSNLNHIVGPMLIAFGGLVISGNIILLGYATKVYYFGTSVNTTTNKPTSIRRQINYSHV